MGILTAFLCHGPRPPAAASALLRHIPGDMGQYGRTTATKKPLTSRQVPHLDIRASKPVMQQTAARTSFLMRHLVQLPQTITICPVPQLRPKNHNVELLPRPLDAGLGAKITKNVEDDVEVEGRHVLGGCVVGTMGCEVCEG